MSERQTQYASNYITPITCECGGKAHLVRRTSIEGNGTESRVFDCLNCRKLLEMVVEAAH
jgi:hypothetical protein